MQASCRVFCSRNTTGRSPSAPSQVRYGHEGAAPTMATCMPPVKPLNTEPPARNLRRCKHPPRFFQAAPLWAPCDASTNLFLFFARDCPRAPHPSVGRTFGCDRMHSVVLSPTVGNEPSPPRNAHTHPQRKKANNASRSMCHVRHGSPRLCFFWARPASVIQYRFRGDEQRGSTCFLWLMCGFTHDALILLKVALG